MVMPLGVMIKNWFSSLTVLGGYANFYLKGGNMKVLVIGVIMWLLCVFMNYLNNLPIVYWSTSKNECIKVHNGNCSDIDFANDKYEKVWVE